METIKYHNGGTVAKSDRKIAERGKFDTPNTQIHDGSLFYFTLSFRYVQILVKSYNTL